jgi:hypothetical protein
MRIRNKYYLYNVITKTKLNQLPKSITILIFILSHFYLIGQNPFTLGINLGQSKYKGDLTTSAQHASFGANIGYNVSKVLKFGVSYTSTTIEGDDAYSDDILEIIRNLDFKSKVNELAFYSEITPFNLELTDQLNLSPFGKIGFGMYKYNPQSVYDGITYNLKDLSTEGQGLPGSNLQKYSLIDDAFLYGIGLNFSINKKIDIKIEVTQRKINNDYLDDVSGYYYNLSDLSKFVSETAAKLSYRSSISLPGEALFKSGVLKRGDSSKTDSYFIKQVTVGYRF